MNEVCQCYISLNGERKLSSLAKCLKDARKWLEKAQKYYPFESCIVEMKELILQNLIESLNGTEARDNEASVNERQCIQDEWESFLLKALVNKMKNSSSVLQFPF